MDVILHLGAHRTGTTAFQAFLATNRAALAAAGTAMWLPRDIRGGPLAGLLQHPRKRIRGADGRLERRVAAALERLRARGLQRLLLSDENLLGCMAGCLAAGAPYPEAWGRVRRLDALFGGRIALAGLAMRPPAGWWASVLAHRMTRRGPPPDPALIDRLAGQTRGWADITADLGGALPGRTVAVWEYDRLVDRPTRLLAALLQGDPPPDLIRTAHGRNASPGAAELARRIAGTLPPGLVAGAPGRWMPFSARQQAALDARHRQDLITLGTGVPGIATFGAPGARPAARDRKEGQPDDRQDRRLARPRREGAA